MHHLTRLLSPVVNKLNTWGLDKWDMLALRLGLGVVLLYAGFSIIANPVAWIGFVPQFVENFYPRESALILHAFFDLFLGAGLLLGWFLPVVSILTFFNLTSILVLSGVDDVTFRDIGLSFGALALFFRTLTKPRENIQN